LRERPEARQPAYPASGEPALLSIKSLTPVIAEPEGLCFSTLAQTRKAA
jgi:hypothetical protein